MVKVLGGQRLVVELELEEPGSPSPPEETGDMASGGGRVCNIQ